MWRSLLEPTPLYGVSKPARQGWPLGAGPLRDAGRRCGRSHSRPAEVAHVWGAKPSDRAVSRATTWERLRPRRDLAFGNHERNQQPALHSVGKSRCAASEGASLRHERPPGALPPTLFRCIPLPVELVWSALASDVQYLGSVPSLKPPCTPRVSRSSLPDALPVRSRS